jgi:precorrin-6B methylase 2
MSNETTKPLPEVNEIRFEIHLKTGGKVVAVFVRPEKIRELLTATDTLGSWLRALCEPDDG